MTPDCAFSLLSVPLSRVMAQQQSRVEEKEEEQEQEEEEQKEEEEEDEVLGQPSRQDDTCGHSAKVWKN